MVYTTTALLAVKNGVGRHVSSASAEEQSQAMMWRFYATLFYIVISTLTKFIVGLFFLRIWSHSQWIRILIWTMLVIIGCFNTLYFFVDVFFCQPVDYWWLRFAPNPPTTGHCNQSGWATITTYIASILNIIVDWTLAILPMVLIRKSQMDRNTKISVCGVLALGSM
jgi:hypothetical protein